MHKMVNMPVAATAAVESEKMVGVVAVVREKDSNEINNFSFSLILILDSNLPFKMGDSKWAHKKIKNTLSPF